MKVFSTCFFTSHKCGVGIIWACLISFGCGGVVWAEGSRSADVEKLYVIQLSSFTKKSNADEFVNLVKTKGYSPFIKKVGDGKIWYKVRVGPYPSRQEAGEVARELKKTHQWSAIIIPVAGKKIREARQKTPASAGAPTLSSNTKADSGDSVDVIMSLFLIWIKAWQEKDTNTYFSLYSPRLEDTGKSFSGWKASRVKTFRKSGRINISVSEVQMKKNNDRIEMSFIQEYQSDTLSDLGRKVLTWKLEGNQWLIIREQWKAIF